MLKIDNTSKRKYAHGKETSINNNILTTKHCSKPDLLKKRKARKYTPNNFQIKNPIERKEIICLCPNGEIKNLEYSSSKNINRNIKNQKHLNMISKELNENKIDLFNHLIDNVIQFKPRKSKGKTNISKSIKKKLVSMKEPYPLDVLKPMDVGSTGRYDDESDLYFEEINWNKKHINKGTSNFRK